MIDPQFDLVKMSQDQTEHYRWRWSFVLSPAFSCTIHENRISAPRKERHERQHQKQIFYFPVHNFWMVCVRVFHPSITNQAFLNTGETRHCVCIVMLTAKKANVEVLHSPFDLTKTETLFRGLAAQHVGSHPLITLYMFIHLPILSISHS